MNRGVVVSPVFDVMSVMDSDGLPVMGRLTPLDPQGSQVSHLSSVQLSPNRVQSDIDVDAVELLNVFETSPRSEGVLHLLSPISTPESPLLRASPAAGSLPDEVAESRDRAIASPAMSLSITNHTPDL